MVDKPKLTPSSTYVLEDEDIDELDELTLTSVIRDAADLPDPDPIEEDVPDIDDFDFDVLSPKE